MTDILKPALWFLIIIALCAFISNRELQYREQISKQDKQIDRLVKDYRAAELRISDTHTLGYQVWSKPPVIETWMDSQVFLRRLADELEGRGCNVVVNKTGGNQ